MNLTLYAITAFIILGTDGNHVLSKHHRQENNPSSSKSLASTKEQRVFEKRFVRDGSPSTLPNHTKNTGDIILYDGRLAVYKHSLDLIFYLIVNQDENELMINTALSAFSDAVHMLLRNQVEKRAVLENLPNTSTF